MANLIRRENRGEMNRARTEEFFRDPFRRMDALLRWDPYRDVFFGRGGEFVPTFDVKETKDGYVVKADLPGVREEDIELSLTGNLLTISGERQDERRDENDQNHIVERSYGRFARSFTL